VLVHIETSNTDSDNIDYTKKIETNNKPRSSRGLFAH
jgi:hypothetical protein